MAVHEAGAIFILDYDMGGSRLEGPGGCSCGARCTTWCFWTSLFWLPLLQLRKEGWRFRGLAWSRMLQQQLFASGETAPKVLGWAASLADRRRCARDAGSFEAGFSARCAGDLPVAFHLALLT
jgi:hypothetical protein